MSFAPLFWDSFHSYSFSLTLRYSLNYLLFSLISTVFKSYILLVLRSYSIFHLLFLTGSPFISFVLVAFSSALVYFCFLPSISSVSNFYILLVLHSYSTFLLILSGSSFPSFLTVFFTVPFLLFFPSYLPGFELFHSSSTAVLFEVPFVLLFWVFF